MRRIWVLATVLACVSPALADDGENAPAPQFHKGQLGISARFGVGLRGIVTYEEADYCGKTDTDGSPASVCTGRSPLRLDLEAAYGVARHVELLLELRIGLEQDFGRVAGADGPRPFHLSPGARFFFGESKRVRMFITAQALFDFTGYKDSGGVDRGADVGLRSLEGVWIDLHRTYGLYFYVGETLQFRRWLEGEFEGGFGFQGRYP